MSERDWVTGDLSGQKLPAHAEALREGGAAYLTQVFRASGALSADNAVARITQFEDCPGGSTGRKLLLGVAYEKPSPELHTELFVKFSRDFADPIRDRGKVQMESEVRLAAISRASQFPIAVPACYFADYERVSGTGILITQRVAFGVNGVEPHYEKCLDYEMPAPQAHYEALIRALARLAGAHKGGRLPEDAAAQFPFEPDKLDVGVRAPYTVEQVQARVERYAAFADKVPQLLPDNIRSADFIAQLMRDAPRFPSQEAAIKRYLSQQAPYIALCHWNANVDNAWFWRDANGALACGLMDWGHVSQMNVAMALWGALSAAELSLWDNDIDHLLNLFVHEYHDAGGPTLDVAALAFQVDLYIAIMGVAWMLDAPALIEARTPDLILAESRFDARIKANERARNQLQIMSVFLNRWRGRDFGAVLDRFLSGAHV
jgi:hypothetical protein